jgi:hypothetical protein
MTMLTAKKRLIIAVSITLLLLISGSGGFAGKSGGKKPTHPIHCGPRSNCSSPM